MMKVVKLIVIASLSAVVIGCSGSDKSVTASATGVIDDVKPQSCTNDWYAKIDRQLVTGDGQGHGPDLGSLEWRSVIEFKLGIRGDSRVPQRNSEQWCDYINTVNTSS
ncbi:hypothetical protein [Moritella sp. Urea-trap-13]|uniref:hypothetical protein n=1 Tax=Moritella sp. Urea-trap-13 TaxID=2058327 RepID=UPI000C32DEA2|nr:hypothetical protein [Moritella sp. Urea-trap-13]PKH06888.1 hypothetical protein CXF93_13450 [Moritella sp. Urea-trap-13]